MAFRARIEKNTFQNKEGGVGAWCSVSKEASQAPPPFPCNGRGRDSRTNQCFGLKPRKTEKNKQNQGEDAQDRDRAEGFWRTGNAVGLKHRVRKHKQAYGFTSKKQKEKQA